MGFALVQDDFRADSWCQFGVNVTAGNAIVVTYGGESSLTGVTDTQGNTYALVVAFTAGRVVEIWLATNINGGANTVTAAGGSAHHLGVSEWSYADTPTTDDTASDSQAADTAHPCGSVTGSTASSLFVTCSRITNAFASTKHADYTELSAGSSRAFFQYRIAGAVTSDAEWTSGDNEDVTSCQAVFSEGAAGGLSIPIAEHHYRQMAGVN